MKTKPKTFLTCHLCNVSKLFKREQDLKTHITRMHPGFNADAKEKEDEDRSITLKYRSPKLATGWKKTGPHAWEKVDIHTQPTPEQVKAWGEKFEAAAQTDGGGVESPEDKITRLELENERLRHMHNYHIKGPVPPQPSGLADNLIQTVKEFEEAAREFEIIGSKEPEYHEEIENRYKSLKRRTLILIDLLKLRAVKGDMLERELLN